MPVGGAHEEMHSEADVVQACIDVYGDRIDRAETLVRQEPGPAPDLPAVGRRGGGQHPDVLRHPLDALPRRAGAPAVGPAVPRPHDRPVRRRLRAVLRGRRRVRPARPGRGRGTPLRRGRARRGSRRAAARTPRSWPGALLGELHYERGELDEAERLLEESRELGAESGVVDFMIATYAVLARIKAHRGADARRAARRGRQGRRAARPPAAVGHRRSPNGSGSSWPRGRCARPAEWRRTCPTARPAPAGSAW